MTADRRTDDWGRVILNPDRAFDLAYQGLDIWALPVDENPEIARFNDLCRQFDTGFAIKSVEPLDTTPAEEHARRTANWLISDDIKTIGVREFLLSLCKTDIEIDRVNLEMDMFEERDLIPLLQLMIYLVDHFRQTGIIWGVGRGSSVASYCLYLLGVHRVDSIRYKLDIKEFLK